MEAPRYAFSGLHFGKFQDLEDFQRWRVNFKTEVCVSTSTPELTMSWINEVETARSVDDLLKSQSIEGEYFLISRCEDCEDRACVEKDYLHYFFQKES